MFGARRLARSAAAGAVATVLVGALAACQPPPPRPSLVVTTQADGDDIAPGDGVCASPAAGGQCTLRAAITEANALGVADLVVPAGDYRGVDPGGSPTGLNLVITGNVRLNWDAPQAVGLLGLIDIRPGGKLAADGIRPIPSVSPLSGSLGAKVGGVLLLKRSVLTSTPRVTVAGQSYVAVDVAASGAVAIQQSVLIGWTSAVRSTALTLISDSTLMSASGSTLDIQGEGVAYLRATVLTGTQAGVLGGCAGTPPASLGYVHTDTPCLPVLGPGDAVGPGQVSYATYSTFALAPTSPLIDAIPLGTAGCPIAAVDINGNPRAVDGNGDGVVACDIGAIEYQPAP